MAFLEDLKNLLTYLETSQWNHIPNLGYASRFPILSKPDLRKIKMDKGVFTSKTSGSTGEPLTIEKTYEDLIWARATNIRELLWKKWDTTKTLAVVNQNYHKEDLSSWGLSLAIFPVQGKAYTIGNQPISVIQQWLEEKNPHYIVCFPSIKDQLNLSKVTNFIDWKGTGEIGGTMYSSEECGTIAIQCPDNTSVMHVMENLIVEEYQGSLLVTSLTNPYIKRYAIQDCAELTTCACGRKLQTITNIKGRIRNMFTLPNGDKKWPMFGSKEFDKFGISRYKAIQTSISELEFQIVAPELDEEALKATILKWLESPINITIKYVSEFKNYKFEEFVSLVG